MREEANVWRSKLDLFKINRKIDLFNRKRRKRKGDFAVRELNVKTEQRWSWKKKGKLYE